MNLEQLIPAVQEAPAYMQRFSKFEYTKAFREYTERFGPLYTQAARETAGDPQAMTALAEGLMDHLEAGWKAQRIWNRAVVQANEKQMMIAYLSPMLLGLEEPLCQTLAETLRDVWAARRPKDAYGITTFKQLRDGFHDTILGIDFGRRRRGSDDEED